MKSARRAVIDVGTNSIKLLVADVAGHAVQPVWEESKQTRLGRGFYETRRLPKNRWWCSMWAAAARNSFWGRGSANGLAKVFRSERCGCWKEIRRAIRRSRKS